MGGVAERVAVDLARRCAGTFIARPAPLALADAFTRIVEREGFELAREWRGTRAKSGERVLAIYSRVHPPLSDDGAPHHFIVKQPSATRILDYSRCPCVHADK
ncbi:hypothetical protein [Mesorhizobium caraganae]|uniref:hypothetical protein n=1 Tax=Mesorhizobium caraganae TaxID=483206 RepID=UPI003ED07BB0